MYVLLVHVSVGFEFYVSFMFPQIHQLLIILHVVGFRLSVGIGCFRFNIIEWFYSPHNVV